MTLLQKSKQKLYIIEGTLKDADIDIKYVLAIESCKMLGTTVELSPQAETQFDRLAKNREIEVCESDFASIHTLEINGINLRIIKEKAVAPTTTKERNDT